MKTFLFISLFTLTSTFLFAKKHKQLLTVEVTKTEISCFGYNDGKIHLTITGGTFPYQVTWDNTSKTDKIENLAPGTYYFKVIDKKGEEVQDSVIISAPKPLSVLFYTPTVTDVSNFNANMNLLIRGGSPWEDGLETSFYMVRIDDKSYYKNPELIPNGVHELEIEDANGCKFDFKVNLSVKLKKDKDTGDFIELNHSDLPQINMLVFPYHLM